MWKSNRSLCFSATLTREGAGQGQGFSAGICINFKADIYLSVVQLDNINDECRSHRQLSPPLKSRPPIPIPQQASFLNSSASRRHRPGHRAQELQ